MISHQGNASDMVSIDFNVGEGLGICKAPIGNEPAFFATEASLIKRTEIGALYTLALILGLLNSA